jgi:hypothetical protein
LEKDNTEISESLFIWCYMKNLSHLSKLLLTESEDVLLDTLVTRKSDPGLVALTNKEDVGKTSSERDTRSILDLNDIERAGVTLNAGDDTNATHVTTLGDHDGVAELELDVTNNLASGEVDLDGVVDLDDGVSEADSATVVGGEVGDDSLLADGEGVAADGSLLGLADLDDTAELVRSLNIVDLVEDELALGGVEEAVLLASLLDGDDIHETSGVVELSADLAIDLDEAALDNSKRLTTSKGVLEAVAEDQGDGEALTDLVGTSGGTGSLSERKRIISKICPR